MKVTRSRLLAFLQRLERAVQPFSIRADVRVMVDAVEASPRFFRDLVLPPSAPRVRAPASRSQAPGRALPPAPKAKPLHDRLKARPQDTKSPTVDLLGDQLRQAEGARALLLEIIRRAAYDWVLYRASRRLDQKVLAEDAFTWLFQEDKHHPNWQLRRAEGKELTALVNICVELDLDVNRVRAHIKNLTPNKVMSSGRPPENSRASDHSPSIRIHTSLPDDLGGVDAFDFDSLLSSGGGGDD